MVKPNHSKRYREIAKKRESKKHYSLNEAWQFLQENNLEKSTNIKAAFSLVWNEKKQPLRKDLLLPYSVQKPQKIAIIGEDLPSPLQNKEEIQLISVAELSQKIKQKKISWGFQILLAHSSQQEKIKPLAKVLGPKKMFPNNKNGTLTEDLVAAVAAIHKGKTEIKTDKHGNIHTLIGKTSFSLEELSENYRSLYKIVMSLKPTNWKGDYLQNITLSTVMGPGIKILT